MALCNVSHYSSYFFHKRLCLKTHLEFYLCLEYRKSQDSIALTPAIRKAKKMYKIRGVIFVSFLFCFVFESTRELRSQDNEVN